MGTPDGGEQTYAKDPEKLPKIDVGWGDGSREQQTSTTLKVFSLGETEGVRTLTNVAGMIKWQGTFPWGPKTRFDWLDKLDAHLPLMDVISSISLSAIMTMAIHTIFFIHHFLPLLMLFCPLLIQKGFLRLTCCVGTNLNKVFSSLLFCGYHIYRLAVWHCLMDHTPCWIHPEMVLCRAIIVMVMILMCSRNFTIISPTRLKIIV